MNLDKVGGRKFVLTLICIGVGTAVEVTTQRGMTVQFAGLLATLVATFGAANAFNTAQALNNPPNNDVIQSGPSFGDLKDIHSNMELMTSKIIDATETAVTAAKLANGVSERVEQVGALAKAALKVNQG